MTHDYISWVLGLQGWERAHCEDDYFAGEEDTRSIYIYIFNLTS